MRRRRVENAATRSHPRPRRAPTRPASDALFAPHSALEQRLGLGLDARSVAAGGPGYPAVSPGIPGDRQRAFRGQREELPPDRGEIAVR